MVIKTEHRLQNLIACLQVEILQLITWWHWALLKSHGHTTNSSFEGVVEVRENTAISLVHMNNLASNKQDVLFESCVIWWTPPDLVARDHVSYYLVGWLKKHFFLFLKFSPKFHPTSNHTSEYICLFIPHSGLKMEFSEELWKKYQCVGYALKQLI